MNCKKSLLFAAALATLSLPASAAKMYLTAEGGKTPFQEKEIEAQPYRQAVEKEFSVYVDTLHRFQTILGFGGSVTDATAEVFARLPKGRQKEFLEAYFDSDKGIGYNIVRVSIQSNDFSTHYNYGDMAGIGNTNELSGQGICAGHTHAAATVARNYSMARPAGTSQWFLPSSGQWFRFMRTAGLTWSEWGECIQGTSSLSTINNMFENAGVSGGKFTFDAFWWSSTEFLTSNAMYFHFSTTLGAYMYDRNKSYGYRVRPFLAF